MFKVYHLQSSDSGMLEGGNGNNNLLKIILIILIAIIAVCWFFYPNYSKKKVYKENIRKQLSKRVKKIKKLSNKVQNENKKLSLFDVLELARTHQMGVLDSYDIAGTRIPGVEPNASDALFYYQMAVDMGYKKALFEIANIHHHGCGAYEGNLRVARDTYLDISRIFGDLPWIDNEIYQIDNELNFEHITINNPILRNDNDQIAFPILIHRTHHNNITPVNNTGVHITHILRSGGNNFVPANGFNRGDYVNDDDTVIVQPNIGMPYSDAHNTHDTTLNATVKHTLDKLSESTKITKTKSESIKELREFVNNYLKGDKKSDAIKALDSIERNFIPVSHVGKTDSEILTLVWNRIHDDVNNDNRQNIKENLSDYLAECVEYGKVCCATGRVNRIVDSLNAVDPDVQLRSTSMINTELMNKAAIIRNKKYEQLSEEDRKKVDDVNDNDVSTMFNKELKTEINETIKKEYIDSGILRDDVAQKMVGKWIDHI
jgi:hypothetical protein